MQLNATSNAIQCNSCATQINFNRSSHEGHIKPVKLGNYTSHELQNYINLRVISKPKKNNNNLIHVLNDEEQQEYINYINSIRQARGEKIMNQSEENLSIKEAKVVLDRSIRQIYTYIEQGRLKPIETRINGRKRTLIPLAQVEALKAELGISDAPESVSSEVKTTSHKPQSEVQNEEVCSSYEAQSEYTEPTQQPAPQPQIIPVVDVLQLAQLRQEMDNLRRENEQWRQEFEQRQQEREERFEQWVKDRDYKLVETMRTMLAAQKVEWEERQKKNRPIWVRLMWWK